MALRAAGDTVHRVAAAMVRRAGVLQDTGRREVLRLEEAGPFSREGTGPRRAEATRHRVEATPRQECR
jgi:hypothetical protein